MVPREWVKVIALCTLWTTCLRANEEVDRVQARLPKSLGVRIVEVDQDAKIIWFIPGKLDAPGTRPGFTARRLPNGGSLISGRISLIAPSGADEAVARLARAEFGEEGNAKQAPIDSFRLLALTGDKVVFLRERASGSPRDVPVQVLLPDATDVTHPHRLDVIVELFLEYQIRSEVGEVQQVWQVLIDRIQEEAKQSGAGLTLREVETLVEEELQRHRRPSDGLEAAQTRIDERRFLMQLLLEHTLELSPGGVGKLRPSDGREVTVRYRVVNRIETSQLFSATDLRSVRNVTLPMTVSDSVEIHDR